MSKKSTHSKPTPSPHPRSSLPSTLRLDNLTNNPSPPDMHSLRNRIEQLESKVNQLQTKIKSKRKRIRRKSCEVQKKHKFCNRQYGTLVSLNLHIRIKHKKQKAEKRIRQRSQIQAKEEHQPSQLKQEPL